MNSMKKNFIWNLIGSTFNSFISLFLLIIVTRYNGASNAGIFTFAFSNACLLQVIGIYVTRAYQVTDKDNKNTDSDYVNSKIISCLAMILIGILFCFIKGYINIKLYLVILLVFYKALDAFSESIYAIIQKNNDLYKVGISLLLKAIVGTFAFLITDNLTKNILLSTILLIISNVLIIVFYDFNVIKKYNFKLLKINFSKSLLIYKFAFWTFLFTFLSQYLINAPKYAIDNYLNSDIQTIYGIIAMPATVMILIANFIMHPFLPKINDILKNNNIKELNKLLVKMLISVFVIGSIAVSIAYFMGIPVLNILYGLELNNYLINLVLIIVGATFYGMTIIISSVLIAMRKTMSQTVIFLIVSLITYILSNILVQKISIMGATYAYLISMCLLFVLYIFIYILSLKNGKILIKIIY